MRVEELMTQPEIVISPTADITEAARLMVAHGISGLPVIDQDVVVGMLTEGDFLRRAELGTEVKRAGWRSFFATPGRLAAEYVQSHGRKVAEVMTDDPVTIDASSELEDAVETMLARHVKRLPVMRDGRMVGIISRSDLVRALVRQAQEANSQTHSDDAIAAAVRAELARHEWGARTTVRVNVRDGIVDLDGMIFDERQRMAMKVAAENVPGVKGVVDHLTWIEPLSGIVIAPSEWETPQDAARA
jgi:CBS domain-containing protein